MKSPQRHIISCGWEGGCYQRHPYWIEVSFFVLVALFEFVESKGRAHSGFLMLDSCVILSPLIPKILRRNNPTRTPIPIQALFEFWRWEQRFSLWVSCPPSKYEDVICKAARLLRRDRGAALTFEEVWCRPFFCFLKLCFYSEFQL